MKNTNTKKYEKIIKSLAGHCWDRSNKTTYSMQYIKAVDRECQCFVHSSGYYAVCLYNKHEYDLPYSKETDTANMNVIIPKDLLMMERNTPTFFLKESSVDEVTSRQRQNRSDDFIVPLCKIGEAFFNTLLLQQVVRALGDCKIIVPGQIKVCFLISNLGIGVLCPIRVKQEQKSRAIEIA